jgi:hypothetical protein
MRPVPPSPHLAYEVELPPNHAGSIKLSPRLAGRYTDEVAEGLWAAFYGALDRLGGGWYVEHPHYWTAYLSPHLADPASLPERVAAATVVLDALLGAPAAGNEFALIDWAVAPLLREIEDAWGTERRAKQRISLGRAATDFERLRVARAPLLGRHLAGGLALSNLETFREVHHHADPLTAFVICALAQPGSTWSLSSVGYAVVPPLDGVMALLEQRHLGRLAGSPYHYIERTPRLARLLSANEAMSLPCGGRL